MERRASPISVIGIIAFGILILAYAGFVFWVSAVRIRLVSNGAEPNQWRCAFFKEENPKWLSKFDWKWWPFLLAYPTWVTISGAASDPGDVGKAIKALPTIKDVYITGDGSPLQTELLQSLAGCRSIKSLDIGGATVGDAGWKNIGSLENLRQLWLDSTNASDESLRNLLELKLLEYLNLDKTDISDESISTLLRFPMLKEVDIKGTRISEKGADLLRERLTITGP